MVCAVAEMEAGFRFWKPGCRRRAAGRLGSILGTAAQPTLRAEREQLWLVP